MDFLGAAHLEGSEGRTLRGEDRVSAGGFVLVSGCLCLDPGVMANVSVAEVRNQTAQVLKQMEALLMQAGAALTQKSQEKVVEAAVVAAAATAEAAGQASDRPQPASTEMVSIPGEEDRFRCKTRGCNKAYKNRDNLQKHTAKVHNRTAKIYVCNQPKVTGETCDFQTHDAGKMSNHKRYSLAHNRREDFKFACSACQSRFPRRHELDRHIRACKAAGGALRLDSPAGPILSTSPTSNTLHLPSSGTIGDMLLSPQVAMAATGTGMCDMHMGMHAAPLILPEHPGQLVDPSPMDVRLSPVSHDAHPRQSISHER